MIQNGLNYEKLKPTAENTGFTVQLVSLVDNNEKPIG